MGQLCWIEKRWLVWLCERSDVFGFWSRGIDAWMGADRG